MAEPLAGPGAAGGRAGWRLRPARRPPPALRGLRHGRARLPRGQGAARPPSCRPARARVTLSCCRSAAAPTGRTAAGCAGVRVIRADRLDEATFRPPGWPARPGWPCCTRTTWATCTPRSAPRRSSQRVRLVLRMFNSTLANGVRQTLPRLGGALRRLDGRAGLRGRRARRGRPDPLPARADDAATWPGGPTSDPQDVVCGLAAPSEPQDRSGCCRPTQAGADLVLAEATGQPPGTEVAARRLVRARGGAGRSRWCSAARYAASPPARSASR